MTPTPRSLDASPLLLDDEDGGVVIEYGIVIATITLLLVTAGDSVVNAVTTFFAGIPALFPTP